MAIQCTCHCHFSTMAAGLLSYKSVNKLFRKNTKFTKAFSTNSLVILNKPQINLVCRQCAAVSYFRVCFGYLRYEAKQSKFLVLFDSRGIICMRNMFLVLLLDISQQCGWRRLGKERLGGSVSKQTKNWQDTSR